MSVNNFSEHRRSLWKSHNGKSHLWSTERRDASFRYLCAWDCWAEEAYKPDLSHWIFKWTGGIALLLASPIIIYRDIQSNKLYRDLEKKQKYYNKICKEEHNAG